MFDKPTRELFTETVWEYYRHHGRHDLPWRQPEADGSFKPYKILVSELMLQQTQVSRVIPKYQQFLEAFPTVTRLAAAPLGQVLKAWSGLGYNRRAKFLHQAVRQIARAGAFPQTLPGLTRLPGVGPNTAGAILAYAFNQPAIFLETNIRTAYIHHFFSDQISIADKAILELVRATLDTKNPRQWYWALMDYGSYLKQTAGNPNRRSKSYSKQSTFHGSRRQIRGQVIRLLANGPLTQTDLQEQIPDERLKSVLDELLTEQLIQKQAKHFRL